MCHQLYNIAWNIESINTLFRGLPAICVFAQKHALKEKLSFLVEKYDSNNFLFLFYDEKYYLQDVFYL